MGSRHRSNIRSMVQGQHKECGALNYFQIFYKIETIEVPAKRQKQRQIPLNGWYARHYKKKNRN